MSVSVLSYRPFYIYGEVTKPGGGAVPYASGMRVTSAIATAGGYTYRAQEGYVVVTRDGQDRRALPGMRIRPDDIIRVPERYFEAAPGAAAIAEPSPARAVFRVNAGRAGAACGAGAACCRCTAPARCGGKASATRDRAWSRDREATPT